MANTMPKTTIKQGQTTPKQRRQNNGRAMDNAMRGRYYNASIRTRLTAINAMQWGKSMAIKAKQWARVGRDWV